jgi:hypothetical protein
MNDSTIDEPNPKLPQVIAPTLPQPPNGSVTNPSSLLNSPNPTIRQAWQIACWRIRAKNRAGRPPL